MMNLTILSEKYQSIKYSLDQSHNLVHCITNYVTVNDCANVILATGAYPVMADEKLEVEEMVSHSSSLVINIGTINSNKLESMKLAGKKANILGIPVILDPVGASATNFRKSAVLELLSEISFAVIKGNYSEISFLYDNSIVQKGVDSSEYMSNDIKSICTFLSKKYDAVIVATGEIDIITNDNKQISIKNGVPILSKITGTGCMISSIIGSLITSGDILYGAVIGTMMMGIAGEISLEKFGNENLGSYKTGIINSISSFSANTILERGRFEYEY